MVSGAVDFVWFSLSLESMCTPLEFFETTVSKMVTILYALLDHNFTIIYLGQKAHKVRLNWTSMENVPSTSNHPLAQLGYCSLECWKPTKNAHQTRLDLKCCIYNLKSIWLNNKTWIRFLHSIYSWQWLQYLFHIVLDILHNVPLSEVCWLPPVVPWCQ